MELTTEEIRHKLQHSKLIKTKTSLIKYLKFTCNNFIRFSLNSSYQITSYYPLHIRSNLQNNDNKYINPLLWQMGHVVFFYVNLVIKHLEHTDDEQFKSLITIINSRGNQKLYRFYDSHKTPLELRGNTKKLLSYTETIRFYKIVINFLVRHIRSKLILSRVDIYLIMLGILHNEMHNEAFIFTKLKANPLYYIFNDFNRFYNINTNTNTNINFEELTYNQLKEYSLNTNNLLDNIEYVEYPCGSFIQGINNSYNYLIFDNEKPAFKKHIKAFTISKYQITEKQYLDFILSEDYHKEENWSEVGYKWKHRCQINAPLYWKYSRNKKKYFKIINGQRYSVETNLPIVHISYYEAEAYCNWVGGRLPTESEYEYVATNAGSTRFPWGNEKTEDFSHNMNLNYRNYLMPVNYHKYQKSQNNKGIQQLIGNAWEWCQEPIYPYDGFVIDPVYREMSYPFFGYKKICKGGAFSVPDFLIHPQYRNAQYPDCRIQFIGFRVCKNI